MGDLKIEITELALAKLKTLEDGTFGSLLTTSFEYSGVATIVGCVVCIDDVTPADFSHYCPGGINIWGTFMISPKECVAYDEEELAIGLNPLTGKLTAIFNKEKLEADVLTVSQFAEKFYIVRSNFNVPVCCELSASGIQQLFFETEQMITSPKILQFDGADLEASLKIVNRKTKYSSLSDMEVVDITVMQDLTKETLNGPKAVVIDYKKKNVKTCRFDLTVDALAMVRRSEPLECLYDYLEMSLIDNLHLQEMCLMDQFNKTGTVGQPEVFHFLLDHFITIVYPANQLDRDLEKIRAKLHAVFALPTDRPLLMRGNAFTFSAQQAGNELINVHESAGPSNVAGGEPVVVQGRYAYHHYCQQGVDDAGWGCAYRSLQTLCSWFKLQGYTNRSVPTLKEIQQCLIKIGDKPSSFLGSSQWIGSTEVGFCLDTLLGVSSRIVSVSSGDELSMKGGELSHHFKTQGTPVMIGGGNLAHTILGVDYNKKTGDIKFLILDPHYTGAEDLNTIISKGWCGWKGISFWKKGSFYNMCMPLRPKCI